MLAPDLVEEIGVIRFLHTKGCAEDKAKVGHVITDIPLLMPQWTVGHATVQTRDGVGHFATVIMANIFRFNSSEPNRLCQPIQR